MFKDIYCIFFFAAACTFVVDLVEGRFYADNGIDQTIAYRHFPKNEHHQIEAEILHLLGLDHRPHPSINEKHSAASLYLLHLYKQFQETGPEKSELSEVDAVISFINHVEEAPQDIGRIKPNLWFDVDEIHSNADVIKAELNIFVNASLAKHRDLDIELFSIRHGMRTSDLILQSVHKMTINTDTSKWLVWNITGPLSAWTVFPNENLGLTLRVTETKLKLRILPSDAGIMLDRGQREPFLAAFVKQPTSGRKSRTTRSADPTVRHRRKNVSYPDENPFLEGRSGRRRNVCQKKTLYVSFGDLGWQDWIIAPEGYSAFYCAGECSFPLNMNATNHAIVQTLVHLINPTLAPKACCAPTKLTPIMVLYFDDNSNVILKKYKNMVVKACGCH